MLLFKLERLSEMSNQKQIRNLMLEGDARVRVYNGKYFLRLPNDTQFLDLKGFMGKTVECRIQIVKNQIGILLTK